MNTIKRDRVPARAAAWLAARLALWVAAVRDSFMLLLPLTLLGVAATLLVNLPFPALQGWLARLPGGGWQQGAQHVAQASYGMFGLALAVVSSVRLARRLAPADSEALPQTWVGMAALVNFVLWMSVTGGPAPLHLGYHALLQGMLVGLATAELLLPLSALCRVAPDYDSEPMFYHAVSMTLPLLLLALLVLLAASLCAAAAPLLAEAGAGAARWLAQPFGRPPEWLRQGGALLFNHLLWFAGIPGCEIQDQLGRSLAGAGAAAGLPAPHWRALITTFGTPGGCGATLGLVLALLIEVREGPLRRLALLSLLPSAFNISELLVFGLPLALNPLFLGPFLLVPLLLTMLAAAAAHGGLLPLHELGVPWTTPLLLSGYLASDSWRGPALQLCGLLISTLVYLPFVRRAEAQRVRRQGAAFAGAIAAIMAPSRLPLHPGARAGLIARSLLATLRRDIGTAALTLVYQPKHDRQGQAVGVEALLRWTHGRYGPVRPDAAVSLAEENGLIGQLGAWVLEDACACKARWNQLGLAHIVMAINVSPLQLDAPELPLLLARCLKRYRLRPGEIQLEITESQAIPLHQVVDRNLAAIVGMGVTLAMDDFGMGYSSLLHMRRFQIHTIKMDGSLTRDVLCNPTSRDIIHTVAALGQARQVEVVAECVETTEQRDVLAALGCDVFQGYLYSRPLPADECARYLQRAGAPATPSCCAAP